MKNLHGYLLLIILILGFALPLFGISYGLPDLYRYDEISYVETALRFGSTFNFNPHSFTHGSLLNYVLFFVYAAVYIVLFLFRLVSSPADFLIKYYIANPTLLILVGRITQVFFGVGTVVVTYLIGRRLFNKRVGLIGAYLLSISFLYVRHTHYIKADVLACFLLTLAFLFATKVFKMRQDINKGHAQENDTKFFALTGLFIGLAISAKYHTALGYTFLVFLQILSKSNQKQRHFGRLLKDFIFDRKFVIANLMVIVGFLIGEPYALLAKDAFIAGVISVSQSANIDYVGRAIGQSRLLFYFGDMLKNPIGLPVLISSVLSIYLLKKRNLFKKILLLISFPVAFNIFFINSSTTADRFLLAMVPFLVILSAATIDYFLNAFSRYNKKNILLILIIALMSLPVVTAIRFNMVISSDNTRAIARDWIEKNIPSGARIAIEGTGGYGEPIITIGPNIKPNLETLLEDYNRVIASGGKGRLIQQRIKYLQNNPQQITYRLYKNHILTQELVKSIQPDYVILCKYFDFGRPLGVLSNSKEHRLLYERIEDEYKKIKAFHPFPNLRWSSHLQVDYDRLKELKLFNRDQKIIGGQAIYIYKRRAL